MQTAKKRKGEDLKSLIALVKKSKTNPKSSQSQDNIMATSGSMDTSEEKSSDSTTAAVKPDLPKDTLSTREEKSSDKADPASNGSDASDEDTVVKVKGNAFIF